MVSFGKLAKLGLCYSLQTLQLCFESHVTLACTYPVATGIPHVPDRHCRPSGIILNSAFPALLLEPSSSIMSKGNASLLIPKFWMNAACTLRALSTWSARLSRGSRA